MLRGIKISIIARKSNKVLLWNVNKSDESVFFGDLALRTRERDHKRGAWRQRLTETEVRPAQVANGFRAHQLHIPHQLTLHVSKR